MNGTARNRRTHTPKEVGTKLRAVALSTVMLLSVVSGTVVLVAPAAAANISASVTVANSSPGVSTNHNWTTTVGSSQSKFAAIKLNYTNAQTDVSSLDGNAGSVEVTVAGSSATVSSVSANSDAANINFGQTAVSPGDKVVVNTTDDLVVNPSSEGTYTGTIELFAGPGPFQTNDADFEISGGGDTTAPKITNLSLSENSGNLSVTFDSNESLGGGANDLNVEVDGPNGATYTFDRTDIPQTSKSKPYTYTLATAQAYDDGDGFYGANVTVAKDAAGNNGGTTGTGTGLTDSYDYTSGGGGTAYINGTVTDIDGDTVSSAPVFVIDGQGNLAGQVTTDAGGAYSVQLAADTYDVIVDHEPNYEFEVESGVTVSASSTAVVDFQIAEYPAKGTLEGVVEDAGGNSVQGVTVSARDLGYRFSGTDTTNADGAFSISVPASDYVVRTTAVDAPPQMLDNVTVREGETTDVGTVRLPESGYITGTVTDASGTAQKNVAVVADGGDGILYNATDASGNYNITAPPGDYTVSVFAKGQDAGSKSATVSGGATTQTDFSLQKTTVVHSSVDIIDNAAGVQTGKVGVEAEVARGMLQAKLVNTSKPSEGIGGAPHELETLGVSGDTKFRLNMTVTNFTASSLMWGVDDATWSTAENATVTNGTDITVEGTPVQLQVMFGGKGGAETGVGPLINKDPSEVSWPTGRDDRATAGRNQTVYFGIFDLSNVPDSVRNNLKGMSVTTNAQRFSTPSVVNQSLRVWVAAPTKTVAGNDHSGFYQAEIPDSQLSEWGVSDPESELNALYKGDATNFTVTETDTGARIRLDNISYSAGFAEVEADPSESTSGTTTTTATTPERTVATVTEGSSGAASVEIDNVELRDPVVAPLDGVGTDAMTVEEVTATFEMGTNVDNEMGVRATDAPPATVPAVTGDVRSYLTVEVEGNLADRVSRGTFEFSLDAAVAPSDPGAVTVYRYHEGGWQRVTTRHLGGTGFEVVAPGYSTFAVVVADRQSTPDGTATPTSTPEPVTATEPPATPEPVSTVEPTVTSEPAPAVTTTGEPTPTPGPTTAAPTAGDRGATPTAGAGSPGFGVVAVLAALLGVLALARRG